MKSKKILIIDDEPSICDLVSDILIDEGHQIKVAHDCQGGLMLRDDYKPDLILLDVWLPDGDGVDLLKKWQLDKRPYEMVIMMSGHGTIETAVNATQLGAYNFLEKPLTLTGLTLAVQHALEYASLKKENQTLKSKPAILVDPVGSSQLINNLKKQCRQLSDYDASIIIEGDVGSGRHTFAYFLYHQSEHVTNCVEVNAALLSPENVEETLLGSFKANNEFVPGKFEQAQNSILLLDELEAMSPNVQGIFLDLLKNKTFKDFRTKEDIPIKFRIISITKSSIHDLINDGQFREDLFYQLNVLPIKIPPLAEHIEDVESIANYYIDFFHQHDGIPKITLNQQAIDCLLHYSWPGNILELKNFIQRLMILQKGQITPQTISHMLVSAVNQGGESSGFNWHQGFKEARKEFERSYFQFHLQANEFNISKVSRITGVERSNLHRKIKGLKLEN